nr:dienelactone hydrolase [Streptomyces sp. DSM 41633]
ELDDADANPAATMPPHSVLTEHLIDEPGQPTRAALDQVLDLFRHRLLSGSQPE